MVHGENGQGHFIRSTYVHVLGHVIYIGSDILVGEHNTLGQTGGAGGEQQDRHDVGIDDSVHIAVVAVSDQVTAAGNQLRHGFHGFGVFLCVHGNQEFQMFHLFQSLHDLFFHLGGVDQGAGAGAIQ